MTNLKDKYDEIVKELDSLGIRAFQGTPIIDENNVNMIVWDPTSDDWRSFLQVAKDEGAKSMIVAKGEGFASHPDDLSSITLLWLKDGVTYMYRERAKWWSEEFGEEKEEEERDEGELETSKEIPPVLEENKPQAELSQKTEEELAAELISFISRRYPEGLDQVVSSETYLSFWRRKGIIVEELEDPKLRMKVRKAERLAQHRFQQAKSFEIMNRTDDELANEEVEFLKKHEVKEFSYMDADLFWETKGAVRYTAEPGLRYKIEKVDSIVRNMLHQHESSTTL